MAPLTFADTHNMVAYLSKSDAREGFDQILDFLNASTIRYALTVNPTIYVSCIKQFWSTTKLKTVNGVVQLQALIDGKKVFVSEAIIRRDLHLEDAKGVECLPNNEIFEELAKMGAKRNAWNEFSSTMASAVICLAIVFLDNKVDDMTSHHTKYTSHDLTQKVFANMRRVGKGFSRNETPLFDTMLVQPQTQADEDVEMPVDEEQPATIKPTHSSPYDSPLTGVNPPRSEEGSLQLAELMAVCTTLQRKVDALEKDKLAQATEILSLKKRVEKLKKRRKGMISDIDVDAKISLVDETQRLDDDLIFNTTADLGGEEVVVKPEETSVSVALDVEVSAAEPAVTIVSSLVTTNSVTITAVEPVSVAAKELTDNDMTMAEALAELRTSKPKVVTTVLILNFATTVTTTKPKAKGITIQEPSVTQKIAVSFIKKASMAALAELHDADRELAARMTLEENEKYTDEERARMLAEFIKNRKKQLAVERAEAIRSKL
ncbi:hypothetical protein Tco_1207378 [Tanacetum coccineum]